MSEEKEESSQCAKETGVTETVPTKKLSLQERLAIAAQKKASDSNKKKNKKKQEDTVKEGHGIGEKAQAEECAYLDKVLQLIDDSTKRDDILEAVKRYVSAKTERLESKIVILESELKKVKTKTTPANKTSDDGLLKKLKEKEDQIHDLLDEGAKLSKKELALNQTIKRLKSRETELESDLSRLESTIEELNAKIDGMEKSLDMCDVNERQLAEERLRVESLQAKYEAILKANDGLTDELKEIKFSNLDGKLKNIQKELDEERQENEQLNEDYKKLNLLHQELKKENEETISNLQKELKSQRAINIEREAEIKRLEEKVEELRYHTETTISNKSSDSSIELLQTQYDQAQENWKLIESTYLRNISKLETRIDELQIDNVTYSKKIKVLTNDLKQKNSEIKELQETNLSLLDELKNSKKQNDKLKSEIEDLTQRLNQAIVDCKNEKESLVKKIEKLQEESANLESTLKLRMNEFNSSTSNIPQNSFYLQDLSSASSLNFKNASSHSPSIGTPLGRQFSNKRLSLQFGEGALAPRLPSSSSAFTLNKLNNIGSFMDSNDAPLGINTSARSISEGLPEFTVEEEDPDEIGMDATSDRYTVGEGVDTSILNNSNEGVGVNVQLIKKLGDHARMLELEVSTLKDETLALEKEKECASAEIGRLIEENSKVNELKHEIELRDSEVRKIDDNYQRVLVLLGEKEERLGELNEDIEDLKVILREQVQQMVEMQEKINELSKQ
ncbi:hypothetical protein JL09_g975 [Pichia kudriavzevii]|uniref:TATA element modulatory factor 1 TATA binding domain-containing protein n=1 Tax=Pichia kudriavzevii TaxID=4909 RepID=A0A099P6X0_PICKU|nr:hypothetical protein JL09_g975 [Pichia kudriavzevii]